METIVLSYLDALCMGVFDMHYENCFCTAFIVQCVCVQCTSVCTGFCNIYNFLSVKKQFPADVLVQMNHVINDSNLPSLTHTHKHRHKQWMLIESNHGSTILFKWNLWERKRLKEKLDFEKCMSGWLAAHLPVRVTCDLLSCWDCNWVFDSLTSL